MHVAIQPEHDVAVALGEAEQQRLCQYGMYLPDQ